MSSQLNAMAAFPQENSKIASGIYWKLCGPQRQSGRGAEEKDSLSLTGNRTGALQFGANRYTYRYFLPPD
jgi:hypothetical protein